MAKNENGLTDQLKLGIENLSGVRLDEVRVHYNSSVPAQLNAQAYTQGTDIHLGPGQQRHLPHEAWHVVQQAQGRVSEGAGSHIGLNREPEARSVEPDLLANESLHCCRTGGPKNKKARKNPRPGSKPQDQIRPA